MASETRNLKARAFAIALVSLLVVSTLLLVLTVVVQARQQASLCRTANVMRSTIRLSLLRQQKNLPKLTYFRAHPSELASQRAEIARELSAFANQPC